MMAQPHTATGAETKTVLENILYFESVTGGECEMINVGQVDTVESRFE